VQKWWAHVSGTWMARWEDFHRRDAMGSWIEVILFSRRSTVNLDSFLFCVDSRFKFCEQLRRYACSLCFLIVIWSLTWLLRLLVYTGSAPAFRQCIKERKRPWEAGRVKHILSNLGTDFGIGIDSHWIGAVSFCIIPLRYKNMLLVSVI
jgi:hypothetical protein